MNNQNIADNFTACPACQNIFNIEHEIKPALARQKAELKKLITEEIVTCQKTGEPTSRLTSLYNKI